VVSILEQKGSVKTQFHLYAAAPPDDSQPKKPWFDPTFFEADDVFREEPADAQPWSYEQLVAWVESNKDSPLFRTMEEDIAENLRLLTVEGHPSQLQLLGKKATEAKDFDHSEIEAAAAWATARDGQDGGVYVTLNPLKPSFIQEQRFANTGDVARRVWLPIDVDPVRAAGFEKDSATDNEKFAAHQCASGAYEFLTQLGFPEPLLANSGNGYWLLYRIELPVEDGGLVERFLKVLSQQCSTEAAKIDTLVHDAVRKIKVFGTMASKGPDTCERPHRRSALYAPEEIVTVPKELLEQVAALGAGKPAQGQTKQDAGAGGQTGGGGQGAKQPPVRHYFPGVEEIPGEEKARRAKAYVKHMPIAVMGNKGHNALFAVACRLVRGFALSVDDARPILREYANGCKPPWLPHELHQLEHKLEDADDFDGPRGKFLLRWGNYYERTLAEDERKPRQGRTPLSAPDIAKSLHALTNNSLHRCYG
jgi:hypothetical protein